MKNSFFIALVLLVVGCSPIGAEYIGERFEPVAHVDIYYNQNDVKREYKTIGKAYIEVYNTEMQEKAIISKAKAVGADAILFLGFGKYHSSDSNGAVSSGSSLSADFIKYLD